MGFRRNRGRELRPAHSACPIGHLSAHGVPAFAGPVPGRGRLTLVELMIVIAIVAILAAIAIPQLYQMQLRAKRAEVPSNVVAISNAHLAYHVAHDTFVFTNWNPSNTPSGKVAATWNIEPEWEALGFSPDGRVRGAYLARTGITGNCNDLSGNTGSSMFTIGRIDCDGNNQWFAYSSCDYEIVDNCGVTCRYEGQVYGWDRY